MSLFLKRAGLSMTNVTYRGNQPALTDVIAGHVPAMFSVLAQLSQLTPRFCNFVGKT
jgi:tripartite-type tricarboxylate transporter receptor subunit TctC